MKKNIFIILISVLVLSIIPVASFSATAPPITINNIPVQFTSQTGTPFIDGNNRTLVPMRVVMEQYGCTVDWEQSTQTAIVSKDSVTVRVPIGQSYMLVNGTQKTINAPAQVISGRTYLPIKSVLEAVGGKVEWDNASKSVVVKNSADTIIKSDKIIKIKVDGNIYPFVETSYVNHENPIIFYNIDDTLYLYKNDYYVPIRISLGVAECAYKDYVCKENENPYIGKVIGTNPWNGEISIDQETKYLSETEKEMIFSIINLKNNNTFVFSAASNQIYTNCIIEGSITCVPIKFLLNSLNINYTVTEDENSIIFEF